VEVGDLAALGIAVDTSEVKKATGDLDKLADSAKKAGDGAKTGTSGIKSFFDAVNDKAGALERMSGGLFQFNTGLPTLTAGVSAAGIAIGALALGATALVAGVGASIASTIEWGGTLNDLSIKTGLSTDSLQILKQAADTGGSSFESMQKAAIKLSQNMVEANAGNEKAAVGFKALGISTTDATGQLKTTDDMMFEVAKKLSELPDGAEKTAIGMKLMGKGFADAAPGLKDMADKSGFFISMSPQVIAAADNIGDNMTKMGAMAGQVSNMFASQFIPELSVLSTALLDVAKQGFNALMGAMGQVASDGTITSWLKTVSYNLMTFIDEAIMPTVKSFIFWKDTIVQVATIAGGAFDIMKAGAAALAGDFDKASQLYEQGKATITAATAKIVDGYEESQRVTTTFRDAYTKAVRDMGTASGAAADATGKHSGALKDLKEKVDPVMKAFTDLTSKLNLEHIIALEAAKTESGNLSGAQKELITVQQSEAWGKWTQTMRDQVTELINVKQKDEDAKKAKDDHKKATEDIDKAIGKLNDTIIAENGKIDDQIKKQKLANDTYGLGKTAVADYELAILRQQAAVLAGVSGEDAELGRLQDKIAKLEELRNLVYQGDLLEKNAKAWEQHDKDVARSYEQMIDKLGDAASDFLSDFVKNGTSAFQNLWDNFKSWALKAFFDVAGKQVVVSLVGSVTGGATGGGGATDIFANLLGGNGSGAGSVLSDMASGLGSLLTGSMSLGTAFTNLGTIIPTFTTMLEGGATVGAALNASLAGTAASFGAVIPVVGAVAAAGYMLYNFLESKKGGPKEGGFATSGATPGITGTDSTGRWFTPNGEDAGMQAAVNGMSDNFEKLLAALGGTGSATFAQGFDTDPKGSAQNNVHTGTWVNGTQVFNAENPNSGRSTEDLQAELELQSMQAILAALQASELPAVIDAYLDSVDVSTATVEQIQAALQHAAELKVLVDAVSALPEEMSTGLLNALGASDELDAKIAAFAMNFKAFSEAAGDLQDQLDRDPQADAMKALAAAHQTTYEKVGVLRDGLNDSLAAYDGSAESTRDLVTATQDYINAQVAALVQIQNIRDDLDGMFGNTQRTFEFALMDSKQKEEFFVAEAQKTVDLLKNTTDPAKIAELSKIVNDDLTSALGYIDPIKQKEEYERLKGILTDAQTIANAQLDLAEEAVVQAGDQSGDILDRVQTALDAASAKQQQAAQDLIDAAAIQKENALLEAETARVNAETARQNAAAAAANVQAANTPQTVNVEVTYSDTNGP